MRGRVLNFLVEVLLSLASAVTFWSKSRRTRDHILLSDFRLGSLFVASYNSHCYEESILTHKHKGDLCAFGGSLYMFSAAPVYISARSAQKNRLNSSSVCVRVGCLAMILYFRLFTRLLSKNDFCLVAVQ
jgi:hypothetical protein